MDSNSCRWLVTRIQRNWSLGIDCKYCDMSKYDEKDKKYMEYVQYFNNIVYK